MQYIPKERSQNEGHPRGWAENMDISWGGVGVGWGDTSWVLLPAHPPPGIETSSGCPVQL